MTADLGWLDSVLPDPSEMAAPAAAYRRLIDASPTFSPDGSTLVLARHHQVTELLRNPVASNGIGWGVAPKRTASLIMLDPPDHTRIRTLVSKAFTPGRVERFRPAFETVVEETIDAFPARAVEIVEAFALPLPVVAISELMGIPREDRERFARWATTMAMGMDGAVRPTPLKPQEQRDRRQSNTEFRRFIDELAAQRRESPTNDMFSDLALATEDGVSLTPRELVRNIQLILVAGHDTTVSTLATGAVVLAQRPDMRERIVAEPEFAQLFVDEVIRLYSPVQMTLRYATDDIEMEGVSIPSGTVIIVCTGAANVDRERFEDPSAFNPDRVDTRRHVAFGNGIHRCIGAALARMEGAVALRALAARVISPRVDPATIHYRNSLLLHQMVAVPMQMDGVRPTLPVG